MRSRPTLGSGWREWGGGPANEACDSECVFVIVLQWRGLSYVQAGSARQHSVVLLEEEHTMRQLQWVKEAVIKIEADFNRSSNTHLIKLILPFR